MQILVMSDSHFSENIFDIIDYEQPDLIIHAGDSQLDYELLSNQNINGVQGNCDFDSRYPKELTIASPLGDIFLTHGHNYGVNFDHYSLVNRAKELGAKIAIYGHTHVVNVSVEEGILVINPGSTRQSRCHYPETYIMIDTEEKELKLKEVSNKTTLKTINLEELGGN